MKTTLLRHVPRHARLQPVYQRLHTLALAGMNLDAGASIHESSEANSLAYLACHPAFEDRVPVVFDVGANVGNYVERAISALGDRMQLFAFEPSASAFDELARRFRAVPNVRLFRKALGESAAEAPLYSDRPGSEISSLFKGGFEHWELDIQRRETVEVARLDDVCAELRIAHIDLLKLDVEGGELPALRGAGALLQSRAIDLIQFEFGTAAMGPRVFFRDIYELLTPHYRVHRLVGDGLAPIDTYDTARCEIFTTASNYLGVSRDLNLPLRPPCATAAPNRRRRSRGRRSVVVSR